MPETIPTLRAAKQYLFTLEPQERSLEFASWDLSPREEFFIMYGDNPSAFIRDCFEFKGKENPAPYQLEIVENIFKYHRATARGPRGLGKTSVAAWTLHFFVQTRIGLSEWKVVTTAGVARQLSKFLWPEIRKWAKRLKWDLLPNEPYDMKYQLMSEGLKLDDGLAMAVTSDNHELIEGAHAEQLLYIYDESKAIAGESFDASEGAFSNAWTPNNDNEAFALAASSPGEPKGRFHDIDQQRPGFSDWHPRSVTLKECIDAGRLSEDWTIQRAEQWGKESTLYINQVLGEFASIDESSVIPLPWVEAAVERWYERYFNNREGFPQFKTENHERTLEAMGVDVALGGGDSSVIATRYGASIRSLHRFPYTPKTTDTTNKVMALRANLASGSYAPELVVDANGPGAGVYAELDETFQNVTPFVGSRKTFMTDASGQMRFSRIRSAAYWRMRELLDPETGIGIALPPDPELIADLSTPTWREMTGGVIQVEEKNSLKKPKRLGRSPDAGDAVIQCFWEDPAPPRPKARAVSIGW